MKVLLVGSGGREHALAWKLAQSPLVEELYCAPGNPGMETLGECVGIKADDLEGLKGLAVDKGVDLVVVGPEAPLVAGITDLMEAEGIAVAGPSRQAAMLEGSKSFAKEVMASCGVPTAEWKAFTDAGQAKDYIRKLNAPVVVKADGLCAGKGVVVCDGPEQALEAVDKIMVQRAFGDAGAKVVVEQRLEGEEASYLVFTDGEHIIPMPSSQDHKPVGEGDTGPNTGGMGAYSPAPVVTPEVERRILERIIRPVVAEMSRRGSPFKGVLYAGLMIDPEGNPYVLEFNVRFGDPECQPLMMRMSTDLAEVLMLLAQGRLAEAEVGWSPSPSVCVVLASEGYPGSYETGKEITGLERALGRQDVMVFHAGTAIKDGKLVTAGGRVLGVTARGQSIAEAVERAYEVCELIHWDGIYYRRDIAHRALAREGRGGGDGPVVGVVMGSASDWEAMAGALKTLEELGIRAEVRVLSAHRTPEAAARYAKEAAGRGIKVIIAGAGWAAHLAGAMAAHTTLPVIGVPLPSSPLGGLDALLSTVQMPPGVPVATMAVGSGGAKNAALLAAQILALAEPELAQRLRAQREEMARAVEKADRQLPR